jgi:hypothetical protein
MQPTNPLIALNEFSDSKEQQEKNLRGFVSPCTGTHTSLNEKREPRDKELGPKDLIRFTSNALSAEKCL